MITIWLPKLPWGHKKFEIERKETLKLIEHHIVYNFKVFYLPCSLLSRLWLIQAYHFIKLFFIYNQYCSEYNNT